MQVFGVSATYIYDYGVSDNEWRRFTLEKKAMSEADNPESLQCVIHGGAQLSTFLFNSIIDETIHACGKECCNIFLVSCLS